MQEGTRSQRTLDGYRGDWTRPLPERVTTFTQPRGCHRLQPRGSIKAPSSFVGFGYVAVAAPRFSRAVLGSVRPELGQASGLSYRSQEPARARRGGPR